MPASAAAAAGVAGLRVAFRRHGCLRALTDYGGSGCASRALSGHQAGKKALKTGLARELADTVAVPRAADGTQGPQVLWRAE